MNSVKEFWSNMHDYTIMPFYFLFTIEFISVKVGSFKKCSWKKILYLLTFTAATLHVNTFMILISSCEIICHYDKFINFLGHNSMHIFVIAYKPEVTVFLNVLKCYRIIDSVAAYLWMLSWQNILIFPACLCQTELCFETALILLPFLLNIFITFSLGDS
jgi:hypothetical protein